MVVNHCAGELARTTCSSLMPPRCRPSSPRQARGRPPVGNPNAVHNRRATAASTTPTDRSTDRPIVRACRHAPVTNAPFTLETAASLLDSVRGELDEFVRLRADVAEIAAALRREEISPWGGRAELKAGEARLDEILSALTDAGVEVKGIAPLLLDFPALVDGQAVLLCWLEGEAEIAWVHSPDIGFMARRPL